MRWYHGGMTSNSILPASAVDRRLIKAAAKYATPKELSEATLGLLTPEQAVARVLEILDSKTILDEIQERRLLLVRMSEHLDWMEKQRDNEKSWGAIAKMFKLVSDQIERANISLTDVSTKLASEQAGYFVEGFVVGFDAILKRLGDQLALDEETVIELMESGTKASQEYIEGVTYKAEIEA